MNKNPIPLILFMEKINQIASENPSYRLGGSGIDGTCDCIGLIIGAIRRAGGKWPGLHGSNYTARDEILDLKTLTDPNALSVGELVFKHRSPGSTGYNLPERYRSSPDRNDYYHVGVVLSVRPLRIIHMTTPSVTVDTKAGKWSHHGWCRRIQPGPSDSVNPVIPSQGVPDIPSHSSSPSKGGAPMPESISIESTNGYPVKLRANPKTTCSLYWEIPSGATGMLLASDGDWCQVEATDLNGQTRTGWMKTVFIVRQSASAPASQSIPSEPLSPEAAARILSALARIEDQLDAIYDVLGGRG